MHDGRTGSKDGLLWIASRSMGLGRALQKAGYGTRKVAESIVLSGRVQVDGRSERDPKVMIGPKSEIHLDNQPMLQVVPSFLVLNKALRVVCVASDGPDCQLVSEFLPDNLPGLRHVGRMDSRSTGLLLISNDNAWNSALSESSLLENEYRVQVEGSLTELEVRVIEAGINLPKMGTFKPLSVRIVELMNGRTVLNIVLTDGKVRQLRKMFTTLRHKIYYLRRVRVGDVRLGHLAPGTWRHLTTREVETTRELAEPKS
jgi:pseudouridine synthase